MIIYGVAFLAFCTLVGIWVGELLGKLIGVPANVGGVGIAMLLLIGLGSYLYKSGWLKGKTEQGVEFWSAIYIPIVVAMAAQQNVYGALKGGPMAILAGTLAVVIAFALVPVLTRMGNKEQTPSPQPRPQGDRHVRIDDESDHRLRFDQRLFDCWPDHVGVLLDVQHVHQGSFARFGDRHSARAGAVVCRRCADRRAEGCGGYSAAVRHRSAGGAMLRDFAIVATAFGVSVDELKRAGFVGVLALFVGVGTSFVAGVGVAMAFGYTDAVSLTTIGAGAVTYIVGPVTGAAIGASSEVMALSIAAGLIKAILVMVMTPFVAPMIGLNNPRSAVIFGGLMGTSSGVAGGLAATDPKLVPYGCLTAAFYTALGCLLGPSLLFLAMRGLVG